MERSFSLVKRRLMLLFVLGMLICTDVSQINARASSPHRHTGVSERDIEDIYDPILTSWFPEQHNIMNGSLRGRRQSFGNRGIRRREPLVLPYSGELIRLRGHEQFVHSGLVEVYTAGKWGYVCDDRWDLTDADVACKQLGFTLGAISATSTYGTLSDSEQSSARILMNDLQCSGTETSLQECPYSMLNLCSSDEIAGVTCNQDVGCPKNFILGFGKCYKFYTNAKTIKEASSICASDNASLVRIDSVKENHFLSNILKTSLPHIQQWYTAGRKTNNKWQWATNMAENGVGKLNEEKRQEHSQPVFMDLPSAITFNKWFPGWPSYNNMDAEPTTKKGYNCLALSNVYKHPLTESSVVVDYFYWKANKCTAPNGRNFICQMTPKGQEGVANENCYTEAGSSYRGTAAVTEGGEPCLEWSLSPAVNDEIYPGKGLGDHNYCRNPDGAIQPWCWVSHELGTYGFCKLSKCARTETPTDSPTLTPENVEVRLLDGKDNSEGNVEVVIDNKRYRICDANWDTEEATVVCRMLGFSSGGVATNHSYFGVDTNNITLNYIDCNGTESHLSQCSVTVDDANHDCNVEAYAGVICTETRQLTTSDQIERQELKFTETCGQRPFYDRKMAKPRDPPQSHLNYVVSHSLPKKIKERIIGGHFVHHGAVPWQARLHVINSRFQSDISPGYHHCGGAIISQFWLLSAAHCFVDQGLDTIVAIVGDHNQKMKDIGEQIFAIEEVVTHEKYDDNTKDYDLALVRIKPTMDGQGIQFNNYVQPVCLPDSEQSFQDDMKCLVAGWGFINPREPGDDSAPAEGYSIILKAIQVPLLSPEVCGQLYKPYNRGYSAERMLCAGYIAGGIDSCDGDSGGPLVCKIGDAYTIAGITSWGRGCAMKNMPGVYARISTFLPWIQDTISLRSTNNAEKNISK